MYEIAPGNNEMRASEDIKEGDLLAFIPESMLLTVAHAKANSPNVQILREKDLLDKMESPGPIVPLALYFLEERRNPDSKWLHYFETLPKEWDTQMIFMNEEELSWFEGSEILNYVGQFKKRLEHDYALISENIPGFSDKYSEREFMENYKAIQTRMFGLINDDGLEIKAMVPVGDLFNHHNPPGIEWAWGRHKNGLTGVFYTAIDDIAKGT